MDPEHERLTKFLAPLQPGEPFGHGSLTLIPFSGNGNGKLDYVLGADAIEAGTLTVTEVDEGGSVPELLVKSDAETMILLLDGEELIGAKQNRILNTSVLLPPKAETRIPVSCVEQGRWHRTSREFRTGSYSSSSLRARKSRDVGRNLRSRGKAASDQGAVWEEVAIGIDAAGVDSPTGAMHDVVEKQRDSLGSYLDALPYPDNARGIIAAIGGKFAAADCFDQPDTLRRIWPRLISGYALDAIADETGETKTFSAKAVQVLLEHLGELDCEPCPTVGIGQDWRFESEALVGQALVAEDACVHLSAFPNDENHSSRTRGPRIVPPSRRRRH